MGEVSEEEKRLNIDLTPSARQYLVDKDVKEISILLKEVGGG